MKGSLFWQNPHVDVFKQFKILDNKEFSDKKGKISVDQDSEIGRKILKIEGNVSNSNYIIFPGKSAKCTNLGLLGNYVYLQLQVPIGSQFGFNITYSILSKNFKLCFSNLHKQQKKVTENILNIPIPENPNKWSIIAVDSKTYLGYLLDMRDVTDYQIKQIELCASMKIKTMFTSNNLYCPHNLPKDMSFITPKNVPYNEKYQFIMLGERQVTIPEHDDKENLIIESKPKNTKNMAGKAVLKTMLKNPNQLEEHEQPRVEPKPFALQENKPKQPVQEFIIEPTPIMNLKHVQGYSGGLQNLVLFNKETLLYSSGNLVIMMDLRKRTQKMLFGQHSAITSICCSAKNSLIVSTDQNQLSFWNSSTLQRTGFFYTGFLQILNMDLCSSTDKSGKTEIYIVLSALDNSKRHCLMLLQNSQVISKQISDFDIKKVKFVDKNDITSGFITTGKESIRFWKSKTTFDQDNVLTSHSVFLGEHARDNHFVDFVIYQETKKALVVSNLGCLYIVDIMKKEVLAVYQIHEEPCRSIEIDSVNNYIVTSDNQGRVKIWKIDFSEVIMEVKLDSQVENLQILDEKFIICGCLNGTLGILDREKKIFNYLIRSHNDDIIDMKYHQVSRKIITISADCSIRIWEILGSNEALFFQEVYEFRCLDEQVSCIQIFNQKHKIICGFETGNMRVFDIYNYQIVCELDFHKTKINDISINYNDQRGISADQSGKISLFNEELQLVRTIETDRGFDHTQVGFNFRGDLYYILHDPYNLKIYSLTTEACKFWVQTQEQIKKICFTAQQEDFFVITEKAKIKKYKLNENTNEIKLFREYSALHQGEIYSINTSSNCRYMFTSGEDNLLKVWDYHLRGGLTPNFQAYNCGEKFLSVVVSNDELQLVMSYSKSSRNLFCWKFDGNLHKWEKQDEEAEQQDVKVEVEIIPDTNIFSNLSKKVEDGNYLEQPQNLEIKSLYPQIGKNEEQKDPKGEDYQEVDNYAQEGVADQEQEEDIEGLPGNFLERQYVIGFDCSFTSPQQEIIWNLEENYYILLCNQSLIVQTLQQKREQKIFSENFKIKFPQLSPNGKFFIYGLEDPVCTIKLIDSKTLKSIKNLMHQGGCSNILQLQISPCSNYLITITRGAGEDLPFIQIFELASSKILACTQVQEPICMDIKWDSVSLQTLEFALISKQNLYFWRVSQRNTLEFIRVDIEKSQKSHCGDLLCLEYAQCEDRNLLLVGTSQGAILIFDLKTGSLLCLCKGILKSPITKMIFSTLRFICLSNNVNVYEWGLKCEEEEGKKTFEFREFITNIEKKPNIHSIDSVPSFISKNYPQQSYEQVMTISRSGVLWLIDFEESASLKLTTSHISQKCINQIKYHVDSDFNDGQLITAGSDCTIKLFELSQNEQKSEFYTPKKECLSMDIFELLNILVSGYDDGVVRFYDLVENVNLGSVSLDQEMNKKNHITAIACIQTTRNVLAGTGNGNIFMIYIQKDLLHQKIQVNINQIVESVGVRINSLQVSHLERLDLWLVTVQNGKVMVWARKNLRRNTAQEDQLKNIYELEYYLMDNYKVIKNEKLNSELHPHQVLIYTIIQQGYYNSNCQAIFSYSLKDVYFACHTQQNEIQKRNFREHVLITTIKMKNMPIFIDISRRFEDYIVVSDDQGQISVFDQQNGICIDEINVGKGKDINITCMEIVDSKNIDRNKSMISRNSTHNDSGKYLPYLFVAYDNQVSVYNMKLPKK